MAWACGPESYVILCGSENEYRLDMCLQEIGLRAQDLTVILG